MQLHPKSCAIAL